MFNVAFILVCGSDLSSFPPFKTTGAGLDSSSFSTHFHGVGGCIGLQCVRFLTLMVFLLSAEPRVQISNYWMTADGAR